ncbi:MAG: tyrosine-type recombinase/integrase [Firmicutes bacterium]|nr:tyrosine-type recombinase/integrase [Bacillota bacterium]
MLHRKTIECLTKNPRPSKIFSEIIYIAVPLTNIKIRTLRHSYASLLANEGINIQEIARRLGHTNIEITWNTYSHLYPREEERAVNVLNKIV